MRLGRVLLRLHDVESGLLFAKAHNDFYFCILYTVMSPSITANSSSSANVVELP